MTVRVLFVDDDPSILAALRRNLRKTFDLETAEGPVAGLAALEQSGPYAVVVSDFRMPDMTGTEFLAAVRSRTPDTVRIMLTGNADLDVAIEAVNAGNVFRFLTKPVETAVLADAVRAALEQYRLVTAERELLTKTLHGCITMLTDILALVNPGAFSRTARLKRYTRHIVRSLDLPHAWQYELAAMLSQIGSVSLPNELLDKVRTGQALTLDEQRAFEAHPQVARRLLSNIPRLEPIAEMVARQLEPLRPAAAPDADEADPHVTFGADLLRIVLTFDRLVSNGLGPDAAVNRLRRLTGQRCRDVIDALRDIRMRPAGMEPWTLTVRELEEGMLLDEDVKAANGVLLVTKSQEVTPSMIERLKHFARTIGVAEPIRVLVRRSSPAPETAGAGNAARG